MASGNIYSKTGYRLKYIKIQSWVSTWLMKESMKTSFEWYKLNTVLNYLIFILINPCFKSSLIHTYQVPCIILSVYINYLFTFNEKYSELHNSYCYYLQFMDKKMVKSCYVNSHMPTNRKWWGWCSNRISLFLEHHGGTGDVCTHTHALHIT